MTPSDGPSGEKVDRKVALPRPFVLDRYEDESGISGTGIVAQGVEFGDGSAALRWMSEHRSTAVYASMADLVAIHGHGGRTTVRYLPDLFDREADERLWSNHGIGNKRLTWAEAAEYLDEQRRRLQDFVTVLADLDRCEHGRHEGDPCSECGGPSKGNPIMSSSPARSITLVARQIGFGIDGSPVVIPQGRAQSDADSWRVPPSGRSGTPS